MNKLNKKYIVLIKELALTDFKLKYQASVMGYLWSLAKPLMLFSVLYVVFTRFLKIGSNIEHYPVYLLLGVVIWGFFTEITASSLDAIVGKGELIRKIYFPRNVLLLSRSITALLTFALNLLAVLAFILATGVQLTPRAFLFPFVVLELFVLTVGIGFFLSALFVRFRDISHIWEIVLQALFYATPILYPLSLVPTRYANLLLLSPVAQIIQDARYLLITPQTITAWNTLVWKYVWIPYTVPFVVLGLGLLVFNKSAAKFAEEV